MPLNAQGFEGYLRLVIKGLFDNVYAHFRDNDAGWEMYPAQCCGRTLHQHITVTCSADHYPACLAILQRYGQVEVPEHGPVVVFQLLANADAVE